MTVVQALANLALMAAAGGCGLWLGWAGRGRDGDDEPSERGLTCDQSGCDRDHPAEVGAADREFVARWGGYHSGPRVPTMPIVDGGPAPGSKPKR